MSKEDAFIATVPQTSSSPLSQQQRIPFTQTPPLTPPQHAQTPLHSPPHDPLHDSLHPHHHHHHHQNSDLQIYTKTIATTDKPDEHQHQQPSETDTDSDNKIMIESMHKLTLSTPKSTPQPINKPGTKPGANTSTPPFKHSHDHQLLAPHYSHSPTTTSPPSSTTASAVASVQPSSYDCSPQIPPGSPPFMSPVLSPVFSPTSSMSPSMTPSVHGSSTKRHVWLIRHGERADLADKAWVADGGRNYDPPLTRLGVLTAYVTGKTLSRMRTPGAVPQLVVTSPFLRCMQTAVQIARTCNGCPVLVEPGLCEFVSSELFNGVFPGPMLTQEEFVRDYCSGPKGYVPTFLDNSGWRVRDSVPGIGEGGKWETRFDLQDRCRDVAEWLDSRKMRDYESVAIVTHGTCIVMLSMYLDETKAWPNVETPYCCVSHFVGYSAPSRPESPTPLMISEDEEDVEVSVDVDEGENGAGEIAQGDESFGEMDEESGRSRKSRKTNWKAVLVCSQKHLKRK